MEMTEEEREKLYQDISKTDRCLDSIETNLLTILALAICMLSAYVVVILVWEIPNQWPEVLVLVILLVGIAVLLRRINNSVKELAYQ